MKAKVIAFSINKGGAGKTTSACAIAQVLALSNYKVLFIDMDQQKNATRVFDAEKFEADVSYQKLLIDDIDKDEILSMIHHTSFENIDIIPSSSELYTIEDPLCMTSAQYGEKDVIVCLRDNLEKIKDKYNYILIDTAPTMLRVNKEALAAADEVLIPAQTESFSTSSIGTQAEFISAINNLCGTNTKIKGVFFTRVIQRTAITKEYRKALGEELQKLYIDCPIRQSSKAMEANSTPLPLFMYAPKCTTAEDYIRLTLVLQLVDKKHGDILEKKFNDIVKAIREEI